MAVNTLVMAAGVAPGHMVAQSVVEAVEVVANSQCTLKLIFILILNMVWIVSGCSEIKTAEPPETVSAALNKFVRSAPFQYIDLSVIDVQEISLTESDIIFSAYDEVSDGVRAPGHLTLLTHIKDQFYIFDGTAPSIFRIIVSGEIGGPLTREGSGPGEHGHIQNLKANSDYVYATDANSAFINRYDHNSEDFTAIKPIEEIISILDLNGERILTVNKNSSGIAPLKPEQGRIVIRSIDNFTDTLAMILPRIIPEGYHPQSYNSPRASINHYNIIAANYLFLPWFFLYDEDIRHTQTLILQYSAFDEMDIPPMDFFRSMSNEGFGGTYPVTKFRLMENGDLFFSIRRELFHLHLTNNGTYRVAGKYRFYHPLEEEPLFISDIFFSDNENEFYVGSWYFLFKFTLAL